MGRGMEPRMNADERGSEGDWILSHPRASAGMGGSVLLRVAGSRCPVAGIVWGAGVVGRAGLRVSVRPGFILPGPSVSIRAPSVAASGRRSGGGAAGGKKILKSERLRAG